MKTRLIISAMAVGALVPSAFGQLTSTGPFAGQYSEGWESFQSYVDNPNFYEQEPVSIMGGFGTVLTQNQDLAIYNPGQGASFGLGNSGPAQVHGGAQAAGLDSGPDIFQIVFNSAVDAFGGWLGCATFGGGNTITVNFFDASLNFFASASVSYNRESQGDGLLEWSGWTSTTPIGAIQLAGDFVVNDDLQAGIVPEPASIIALTLGGLAMLRRRRK